MIYCGAYKVSDYKNIHSIPEIITHTQTKNNGIVLVVSDTNFTTNNNEITQDFFYSSKKFIEKLGRQIKVFNNIEAIVLNGNIFKGLYSKNNAYAFDHTNWCCSFLRAIYMTAGNVKYGEKPVPVYYVRGDEDCYMAVQNLTVDLRGVLKLCNAVIIGDVLFLHGHNNLPFKEHLGTDFISSKLETISLHQLFPRHRF